MPPAAASEKEGRFLGTPQTPAGGLGPPAPPAQQLHENKEWLVCTKLTILIVNLAVKREHGRHGACCLSSSEWGIIYSTGHFFFSTEEQYGRATQHYPCSTYSLGPRMVSDL